MLQPGCDEEEVDAFLGEVEAVNLLIQEHEELRAKLNCHLASTSAGLRAVCAGACVSGIWQLGQNRVRPGTCHCDDRELT